MSPLSLALRQRRPCSRAEISSVGISSSTSAYAIYTGSQYTSQSWIDIFPLSSSPSSISAPPSSSFSSSSSSRAAGPSGLSKTTGSHAAFSPSGTLYAALREWTVQLAGGVEHHHSSTVLIRDVSSGKTVTEIKPAGGVPFCWSLDGRLIAAAEHSPSAPPGLRASLSEGTRMGIFDVKTGARVGRVMSHVDIITHAAFTSQGHLVTLSRDATLRLTDPRTSKTVGKLELPLGLQPRLLSVSQDSLPTVTAIWGQTVHVWQPLLGELASYPLNAAREGWPLCASADGRYLACRTEEGFDVSRLETGEIMARESGQGSIITAAAFSGDSKTLLLGTIDGDLQIWDVKQPKM